MVNNEPWITPWRRSADWAYSEQLGLNRHDRGSIGDIVSLYISITLHNRSTVQNFSLLPQANKAFCTFIICKIPGGLPHNHYHRNPLIESRAMPPVDLTDQPFDPIPLD